MASSIRVERKANCSRKPGRCRDCAASTASSINSSACFGVAWCSSALPRWRTGGCDGLVFILRIEGGVRRLKLRGPAHSNPTGESQSESIAAQYRVAKSPIATPLPILSLSQPETSVCRVGVRLRQLVLQSPIAIVSRLFHNLLFLCYLRTLDSFRFCYSRALPPWHSTCLLLRGASCNPMRSSVDEN